MRIFTHPDIEQVGDFGDQYIALMICRVCQKIWGDHRGWACPGGEYIGTLPVRPATVTATCARCSAAVDPDTVEQHHERCFRVGDYVRRENPVDGNWIEGSIRGIVVDGVACIQVDKSRHPSPRSCGPEGAEHVLAENLRRIPRPAEVVLHHCQSSDSTGQCIAITTEWSGGLGTWRCAKHEAAPVESVVTVTYDGLTAEQCLERYVVWMREEPVNGVSCRTREGGNRALTHEQLSAARELWSQQLRAAVDARREQERCAVKMPIDAEDLPW